MTLVELQQAIQVLLAELDAGINRVDIGASLAQQQIYDMLATEVMGFSTVDGRFDPGSPYMHRLSQIQRNIENIIGTTYRPSVTAYLNTYSTIEERNASMHLSYNQLKLNVNKLSEARRAIYNQAEYYLTNAVADAYVMPVKYMLMQQVTTGQSIADMQRILRNWDQGKMTDGRLTSGRPTPRLDRYAVQIARDSIYNANAAVNNKIAEDYGLDHFIYVGGLVMDSRPLCRHIVALKRKIALDEMPKLIAAYPQGLYPGTDKDNFIQNRGGWNCLHSAFPVRS